MKLGTVQNAIEEAERFVAVAQKLVKHEKENGDLNSFSIWGSKESGACRRASMELTRILANLRQGR